MLADAILGAFRPLLHVERRFLLFPCILSVSLQHGSVLPLLLELLQKLSVVVLITGMAMCMNMLLHLYPDTVLEADDVIGRW